MEKKEIIFMFYKDIEHNKYIMNCKYDIKK